MRLFLRRQADRRSCREGKDLSWFCSYSNTTGSRCGRCNVLYSARTVRTEGNRAQKHARNPELYVLSCILRQKLD